MGWRFVLRSGIICVFLFFWALPALCFALLHWAGHHVVRIALLHSHRWSSSLRCGGSAPVGRFGNQLPPRSSFAREEGAAGVRVVMNIEKEPD